MNFTPVDIGSDTAAGLGIDGPRAIDRIAQRVDHATQELVADRHIDNCASALHRIPLHNCSVVAEDHHTDVVR